MLKASNNNERNREASGASPVTWYKSPENFSALITPQSGDPTATSFTQVETIARPPEEFNAVYFYRASWQEPRQEAPHSVISSSRGPFQEIARILVSPEVGGLPPRHARACF